MGKAYAVSAVVIFSLMLACSKSAPQSEARDILNEMTVAASIAAGKLDRAATAQEAADIMKAFKSEMAALAAKGEKFDKKHPGINVAKDPEFQPERDAYMASMKKYGISSMKVRIRFDGAKELAGLDEK